ncbi:hypothetical protein H1R20_g10584, partial [Candolleomyces eurysporus]
MFDGTEEEEISEDEMDLVDDFKSSAKGKRKSYEVDFNSLS